MPYGTRLTGLCEYEPWTERWKDARATRTFRHVDSVERKAIANSVRMPLKPGRYGIRPDAHHLADAEPSEHHVQIRHVLAVPIPASIEFHFAEPAEEQKQIVDAHACAIQMTLRTAVLPERRKPSGFAAARRHLEIGVEMN